MNQITETIKELGLEIDNLDIYMMRKVEFGMHVDNKITPIYIKHKPTNTVVICKKERSQHKNLILALNMLKEKMVDRE